MKIRDEDDQQETNNYGDSDFLADNDLAIKKFRASEKDTKRKIIDKMLTLRHNMKYNKHLLSVYVKAKALFDEMVEEHRLQIDSLDEIYRHLNQMIRENLSKQRIQKKKDGVSSEMLKEMTKDKNRIGALLKKMRISYQKLMNIDTILGVTVDKINEITFIEDVDGKTSDNKYKEDDDANEEEMDDEEDDDEYNDDEDEEYVHDEEDEEEGDDEDEAPAMDEGEDEEEAPVEEGEDEEEAPVEEGEDEEETMDEDLMEIIRQLEEDIDSSEIGTGDNKQPSKYASDDSTEMKKEKLTQLVEEEEEEAPVEEGEGESEEEVDIQEILRALREEDEEEAPVEEGEKEEGEEVAEAKLREAYAVIQFLRGKINEVNLLNSKLLFSNKLFRSHSLTESQKMTVIENFDRAKNLREVKLVYATLAESLKTAKVKQLKESFASKPVASTRPSKAILTESNVMADRLRKLAGLK